MEREREKERRKPDSHITGHSSCHAQCSYLPTKKKAPGIAQTLTSRYHDEKKAEATYVPRKPKTVYNFITDGDANYKPMKKIKDDSCSL